MLGSWSAGQKLGGSLDRVSQNLLAALCGGGSNSTVMLPSRGRRQQPSIFSSGLCAQEALCG